MWIVLGRIEHVARTAVLAGLLSLTGPAARASAALDQEATDCHEEQEACEPRWDFDFAADGMDAWVYTLSTLDIDGERAVYAGRYFTEAGGHDGEDGPDLYVGGLFNRIGSERFAGVGSGLAVDRLSSQLRGSSNKNEK